MGQCSGMSPEVQFVAERREEPFDPSRSRFDELALAAWCWRRRKKRFR
jgi:hypothetical protein